MPVDEMSYCLLITCLKKLVTLLPNAANTNSEEKTPVCSLLDILGNDNNFVLLNLMTTSTSLVSA